MSQLTKLAHVAQVAQERYAKTFEQEMKSVSGSLKYDTRLVSPSYGDIMWDETHPAVYLRNDTGLIPSVETSVSDLWKAPIGFTSSATAAVSVLEAWYHEGAIEQIAVEQADQIWKALNEKATQVMDRYSELVAKGEAPKVNLDQFALRFIKPVDFYTFVDVHQVDDTLSVTGRVLCGIALFPGPLESSAPAPVVVST